MQTSDKLKVAATETRLIAYMKYSLCSIANKMCFACLTNVNVRCSESIDVQLGLVFAHTFALCFYFYKMLNTFQKLVFTISLLFAARCLLVRQKRASLDFTKKINLLNRGAVELLLLINQL
jgi:hypothetical protein